MPIVPFEVGTGPTGPTTAKGEEREEMFYGDYSYELSKERMDQAIRAREHDVLVKQLRAAARKEEELPPKSMVARGTAVVTALFR